MWLLHTTTQARAESIVRDGPNLQFVEPGGGGLIAENITFCVEGTPSSLGQAQQYARGKARNFPAERGAALVAVDVPEAIVRAALVEHLSLYAGFVEFDEEGDLARLVSLRGGVIQFDPGPAFSELLAAWGNLKKEIRGVP